MNKMVLEFGNCLKQEESGIDLESIIRNPELYLDKEDFIFLSMFKNDINREDINFVTDKLLRDVVNRTKVKVGIVRYNFNEIHYYYPEKFSLDDLDIDLHKINFLENGSKILVIPIEFHGNYFGYSVFTSPLISQKQAALIFSAVNFFGSTVNLLRKMSKLREEALIDSFLKIPSKKRFQIDLESEINISNRTGKPLSLIELDLDYFKKINDTYGHLHGDTILLQTRDLIFELIEQTNPSYTLYRWGGEEFAILLPNTTKTEAEDFAKGLQRRIQQHNFSCSLRKQDAQQKYFRSRGPEKITASLGVASTGDIENPTSKAFFDLVDWRLYLAKYLGRNQYFSGKFGKDKLTGLYSSAMFYENLIRSVNQAVTSGSCVSVFVVDVVGFSKCVDDLGLEAWNKVKEIGKKLYKYETMFDYIARAGQWDRFILARQSDNNTTQIQTQNMDLARNILTELNEIEYEKKIPNCSEAVKTKLDFSIGVIIYNPIKKLNKSSEIIAKKLINVANTLPDKAVSGNPKEKIWIEFYR